NNRLVGRVEYDAMQRLASFQSKFKVALGNFHVERLRVGREISLGLDANCIAIAIIQSHCEGVSSQLRLAKVAASLPRKLGFTSRQDSGGDREGVDGFAGCVVNDGAADYTQCRESNHIFLAWPESDILPFAVA